MEDFSSLNHTRWECKYHVVFIPKCRRKVLYGQVRQHLGKLFHELAGQRESKILEGHLCVDHVHMLAQALGVPCGGIREGQERDPCRQGLYGTASEFQGLPLLGTRLLRVDGGNR